MADLFHLMISTPSSPSNGLRRPADSTDAPSVAWRATRAFLRLYGRTVSAAFRGLEALPPVRGARQRLFDALEFTSTDVPLRAERSAADGLDGLEIVYLSDVHAGFFTTSDELERVGERISVLAPDIVCLGGDLVANHFHELEHFEALLSSLRPPLGVYAVPGNHEHFYFDKPGETMDAYRAFLEERGVTLLLNDGVRIERGGASLWLCGIDDLDDGRPDLSRALADQRAGEPVVLLSHHPDTFHESVASGVDLQLSGHTHGGQIRLFGWAPVTHSRHGFCDGLFRREDAHLYVSRGIGCSFLPFRVGARPEVTLLRLRVE